MAGHEGNFIGFETDTEFHYEIEKWRVEGGEYQDQITESDLPHVGDMIVKITDIEDELVYYQTIQGPMDDWQFIEDVLEYDFGKEGSR